MSPPNEKGFRQLLVDIAELIRSWWRVDRIRISPDEGKLLRLRAGSLLRVGERPVEVVSRRVATNGAQVTIVYACRAGDDDARLVVLADPDKGCRTLSWFQHGRIRRIDEADVTVYR